jgi:1-acyl-sn-glycerol-3-phosphate acyltransferase
MAPATHDPQAGGRIRGVLMLLPVLIWAFAYLFYLMTLVVFAPGVLRRDPAKAIRPWGGGMLKILGIRLEVHGREHLDPYGPQIILFNHVTIFDLAVIAAVWGENFSVIYKKEFHKIPLMGRLMRFFGMIPIDRSNRERAMQSMAEASEHVREQNKKVLVAPEGTRSHNGRLQDFKRGPFHLALETKAPVVPMVMRGLEVLVPGMTKPARSGVIRVDFLPVINTSDWTRRTLGAHVEEARQAFLQYLPDGLETPEKAED